MAFLSTSYVFIRRRNRSKEFSTLSRCVRVGARRIHREGAKYAVGLEGKVGRPRTFPEAKKRAKHLIKKFPAHKVTMVAMYNDVIVDRVRFATLSKTPPVKATEGAPGIDRIVGWIESEVRQGRLTSRRYAGICVCKRTSSGGHSDHADCAAIDIFGSAHDMEVIRDVVIQESGYFDTKYAILWDRIHFPGGGSQHYNGSWHGHDHISVNGGRYNAAC